MVTSDCIRSRCSAGERGARPVRSNAKLGGKTVIANITPDIDNCARIGRAASTLAIEALARFRDGPYRMGHARMFGDQSCGMDDLGKLTLVRLTEATAA